MSTISDIAEAEQTWGTFESVRERLFNQFQNIAFNPETGLSLEDLKKEVDAYLQAHSDHPRALQKANIYRIVVTQGQMSTPVADDFRRLCLRFGSSGYGEKSLERYQTGGKLIRRWLPV